MLDNILATTRRFIPENIYRFFRPIYHWKLAFMAALWYGFPSRKIHIIAVTGTKGKSSTVEILNAILEEAGYKTALSNTIRYKVANDSQPNLFKMSMPGRFFLQKLIHRAVKEKCQFMIMEMTSEGALLFRHRFIELDELIFTNISPEHIEAHGSYDNYLSSKLSIARNMTRSNKALKTIVVNGDDPEASKFLQCKADRKITYSIKDVEPYQIKTAGLTFTLNGKIIKSNLSGLFNVYNILASTTAARSLGVNDETIVSAIEKINEIPGRVQRIKSSRGFEVVVDYAHTADSLEKFYQIFEKSGQSGLSTAQSERIDSFHRNICILGGTGGGRDSEKRRVMGHLADKYCDVIILTDEDPYDEDPKKIVSDVASGIKDKTPTIIMDRRLAIREAVKMANKGDTILITGKGTDPYIMGPRGTKTPWSDAKIVMEEIESN